MPSKIILFLLCLATGLLSCFHSDDKTESRRNGVSHLRIAIDTNSNFYIDSIRLSSQFKQGGYLQDDTILKSLVYVFDSVPNGKLNISLVSFLDRTFDKNILLQSDTTLFIRADELKNFRDAKTSLLPAFRLNDGDTIVIGLSSTGCFHHLRESMIVSKSKSDYSVGFNTTRGKAYGHDPINMKKNFDSSFAIQIDSFYQDCKTLLHRKQNCISTTSAFIYIRLGNSVFRLPDIGCGDWKGYDKLIKAIDPPWPKEKNAS